MQRKIEYRLESKWGLLPNMGATVTLRELLRIDVAKELTFTGRVVSGTEAARLGLVTRCVSMWIVRRRLQR
jgi:enoyl-CoA hydratase/carnithine racemase